MYTYLQGYPRGDIDLFAVRTDRNRVICLSNDHKALTKQIDDALTRLHELYRLVMTDQHRSQC